MLQDLGCHGKIAVGTLPPDTVAALEQLSGDWLEYDHDTGAIVVRQVQPTSAPIVPTVTSELVHMLATIPFELQEQLAGGELLIHTEDLGRLVRITVDPGGALHVEWAHPNYAGTEKHPFDGSKIQIERYEQRLSGQITLEADDPAAAANALQQIADTFEGLYPEGSFQSTPTGNGSVKITMEDVNLDIQELMNTLDAHAKPNSVRGRVALGSFKDAVPEHLLRVVFEDGKVWMQQPLLWG
jgi:hypothetical protein